MGARAVDDHTAIVTTLFDYPDGPSRAVRARRGGGRAGRRIAAVMSRAAGTSLRLGRSRGAPAAIRGRTGGAEVVAAHRTGSRCIPNWWRSARDQRGWRSRRRTYRLLPCCQVQGCRGGASSPSGRVDRYRGGAARAAHGRARRTPRHAALPAGARSHPTARGRGAAAHHAQHLALGQLDPAERQREGSVASSRQARPSAARAAPPPSSATRCRPRRSPARHPGPGSAMSR